MKKKIFFLVNEMVTNLVDMFHLWLLLFIVIPILKILFRFIHILMEYLL